MLGPVFCTLFVFAAFFVAISAGGAVAMTAAATFLSQPAKAPARPATGSEGEAAKS